MQPIKPFFRVVQIDLIHKGIKTRHARAFESTRLFLPVQIDLIHKGIKTNLISHNRVGIVYK